MAVAGSMESTPLPRWKSIGAIVGYLFIAIAVLALLYEIRLAVEAGAYRAVPAGELWFRVDVGSLNLTQAVIQRYVHPSLWDPVLVSALQWPLWATAGALGACLLFVTRAHGQRRA